MPDRLLCLKLRSLPRVLECSPGGWSTAGTARLCLLWRQVCGEHLALVRVLGFLQPGPGAFHPTCRGRKAPGLAGGSRRGLPCALRGLVAQLGVFLSAGLWAAQISPAPSEEWGCRSHTPVKVRSEARGACGPGRFCANKEDCPFDARAR